MKIDIIRRLFKFYLQDKVVDRSHINMEKVDTILVISNTAIGDTLFATPALKLIKKYYPDKKVIALLNPLNYKLFESNPYIDEVFTFNGKWYGVYKVIKQLKSYNIDITFIMNCNEPQATPLSYCLNSRYIVRIPNKTNEFNFLHYNPPIERNYEEHTINTRIKQLNYIGITEKDYTMQLFPSNDWYVPVNKELKKDTIYIGFQLGASTISRMWFNTHWKILANLILDYYDNIDIILTGSPSEVSLTNELEKMVNSKRLHNLSGKFDICSAAALIDKLNLLITPDTGPLHIASALNTNTIAISVAGTKVSSNPINENAKHIFIQKPKTCTPCLDKRCKYQECMLQITPEEVFENVKKLLGERV